MDFVDAAFQEAKGKIEFTHKSYTVKIADALKGEKAEEIEEAYQYYLQEQEKKMRQNKKHVLPTIKKRDTICGWKCPVSDVSL